MRLPFQVFGFDVSPNPEDPSLIREVELGMCGVIALYSGKPRTCFPMQRRKVLRPVGDVYRRIESGFDGRKGRLVVHQSYLHAADVNVLDTFAFRHNCALSQDD